MFQRFIKSYEILYLINLQGFSLDKLSLGSNIVVLVLSHFVLIIFLCFALKYPITETGKFWLYDSALAGKLPLAVIQM